MGAVQQRAARGAGLREAGAGEPVAAASAHPLAPEVFVELVAAAPDARFVLDPRGRILYANVRAVRMVGVLEGELVGQHMTLLLPTRLHDRFAELARQWRAAPRAVDRGEIEDAYLRLADGSECPVEVSLVPVESAGSPLVAVTVSDARAQRLAESHFREMLESSPDGMLVVDQRGRIVFANTRAGEMLRCPAGQLVDADVDRFVPLEPRTRHAERADGTRFPVEVSLSRLSSGDEQMVVAAVRDASDHEALRLEAQRMRDELVLTVSHELRTPLASIIGYAELLGEMGEEHLSGTARRMLDVIAKNAVREQKLINDLLATSHESPTDRLELAAVDLRAVVATVAQQAGPAAAAAGVTVETEQQGERIAVLADPAWVREVVASLVDNAVKFTPEGGRVTVGARHEVGAGVLTIADTGIGMSPSEVGLACERLYRAPGAFAEQRPGAGLGLTLARDVVQAHGGTLGIDSEPGAGTVVTVMLPTGGP